MFLEHHLYLNCPCSINDHFFGDFFFGASLLYLKTDGTLPSFNVLLVGVHLKSLALKFTEHTHRELVI